MQVNNNSHKSMIIPLQARQKKEAGSDDYLSVYLRDRIELIKVKDIVFLRSDSNYCYVHLADGNKLLTSQTLKHFSERLDMHRFIRTHQSYIVQKIYIKTFFYRDQCIMLSDSSLIPVSRTQKSAVLHYFSMYHGGSD